MKTHIKKKLTAEGIKHTHVRTVELETPLHLREPKIWNLCVSFAQSVTSELRIT